MTSYCRGCGFWRLLDAFTVWCAECADAWRTLKIGSDDKETVQ
jgi:hypothetical protein